MALVSMSEGGSGPLEVFLFEARCNVARRARFPPGLIRSGKHIVVGTTGLVEVGGEKYLRFHQNPSSG